MNVDMYEVYKNKKVYIRDIYDKLEDKVNLFYKNQKVGTYKKEQLKSRAWCMDRVVYLSLFPKEGTCAVYLVPENQYLKAKI